MAEGGPVGSVGRPQALPGYTSGFKVPDHNSYVSEVAQTSSREVAFQQNSNVAAGTAGSRPLFRLISGNKPSPGSLKRKFSDVPKDPA
ncbi:unnamed protein product [Soboliphyme baturini]|uniref:Microtubule-associated protein Jupiter n=1 Tax=Soboliphyme baturini TaxID=241478 RepID=A0A183IU38_9BILA|nr:unnamed protein product [Soboliphyme baturini]